MTISSADMANPPIINPNWLDTETDQKIAVAAYRRVREAFQSKAMGPVLAGPEYFPGLRYQSDADIIDIIKKTMMTIYHASCTCKMGVRGDSMAVVDHQARVFGVHGLRVVDVSAFPILPPGHPQSTVCELYPSDRVLGKTLTELTSGRHACREDCGRYYRLRAGMILSFCIFASRDGTFTENRHMDAWYWRQGGKDSLIYEAPVMFTCSMYTESLLQKVV